MLQNPNNTLQEVRKAYRLLYDYQARILDLISFIGGSFNYKYNGGYSKFSNSGPKNGQGRLDQWAWDWLNMYFYEFNFVPENGVCFSVFLINDTGFFQKRKENKLKTKLSAFDTVENSKTKLIFVVGKHVWDGWGVNWDEDNFILEEEGHKIYEEGDKVMLFKSYTLEAFFDQESAVANLKNFDNYCKSYGVDFRYKERKV